MSKESFGGVRNSVSFRSSPSVRSGHITADKRKITDFLKFASQDIRYPQNTTP